MPGRDRCATFRAGQVEAKVGDMRIRWDRVLPLSAVVLFWLLVWAIWAVCVGA